MRDEPLEFINQSLNLYRRSCCFTFDAEKKSCSDICVFRCFEAEKRTHEMIDFQIFKLELSKQIFMIVDKVDTISTNVMSSGLALENPEFSSPLKCSGKNK